jgi:glucokinase
LVPSVYNLDEPITKHQFLRESIRKIAVPLTIRKVNYDPVKRIGLGLSKLGTSQAIALGAYAFALRKLDAVVDPKRECELNAAQPA